MVNRINNHKMALILRGHKYTSYHKHQYLLQPYMLIYNNNYYLICEHNGTLDFYMVSHISKIYYYHIHFLCLHH
jgi:hypothetical protein